MTTSSDHNTAVVTPVQSANDQSKQDNKPEYAWECNECGSQEYTMSVSYEDACWMGCAGCGGEEFHKSVVKAD